MTIAFRLWRTPSIASYATGLLGALSALAAALGEAPTESAPGYALFPPADADHPTGESPVLDESAGIAVA
jgi:hypothetical protein